MAIGIFISYAREDAASAERLYDELATHRELSPWLDRKELRAGDDWEAEILNSIDASDCVILLLSSRAVAKTGFVQREVRETLDRALLRPEGQRFVIPVRLDECSPSYRGLARYHYIDLFPDWAAGVNELCKAFGVTHYSHQFIAHGPHKLGASELRQSTDVIPNGLQVKLVNPSALPSIDSTRIPSKGLSRDGMYRTIFLNLWTVASADWPRNLYRKSDWNELDRILFAEERSDEDKRDLATIIIRQWSLARELEPYDEDDWRALRKLIQRS